MARINPILMAAVLLVVAACSAALDEPERTADTAADPVTFTVGGVTTRGSGALTSGNLFTMGVFAGYEEESETFGANSVATDYINNVRYTRSFITDPFAGADVVYWPLSGKLSFFAYAPYTSSQNIWVDPDYTVGFPRMSYKPTQDVTNQPDFCIAQPVLDQHKTTDAIPLHFMHSLSQVTFAANYTGYVPSGQYVKIDSIYICHVIGRKTFTMSSVAPGFQWEADSECSEDDRTSYFLRRGGEVTLQHLADTQLPVSSGNVSDEYLSLSTLNGHLYLLPQGMTHGEAYLRVTYGLYQLDGTTETLRNSYTTTVNMPAATWASGTSYLYKFTIQIAALTTTTPTVSVVDWIDGHNDDTDPHHFE